MITSGNTKMFKSISVIYFVIAVTLVISEMFQFKDIIDALKPFLIPTLMLLYFVTSAQRNWIYFGALLFACLSNILFLKSTPDRLLYGIIAYLLYRLLTLVLVYKTIQKVLLIPIIIATLPFLFVVFYLINLTLEVLGTSFYPTIINGVLLSVLGGFSLVNFIFDDNNKNSWLLISSLLFVAQNFIFLIQKYYLANDIFQPLSALIFTISHYTFFQFILMDENQNKELVLCEKLV